MDFSLGFFSCVKNIWVSRPSDSCTPWYRKKIGWEIIECASQIQYLATRLQFTSVRHFRGNFRCRMMERTHWDGLSIHKTSSLQIDSLSRKFFHNFSKVSESLFSVCSCWVWKIPARGFHQGMWNLRGWWTWRMAGRLSGEEEMVIREWRGHNYQLMHGSFGWYFNIKKNYMVKKYGVCSVEKNSLVATTIRFFDMQIPFTQKTLKNCCVVCQQRGRRRSVINDLSFLLSWCVHMKIFMRQLWAHLAV